MLVCSFTHWWSEKYLIGHLMLKRNETHHKRHTNNKKKRGEWMANQRTKSSTSLGTLGIHQPFVVADVVCSSLLCFSFPLGKRCAKRRLDVVQFFTYSRRKKTIGNTENSSCFLLADALKRVIMKSSSATSTVTTTSMFYFFIFILYSIAVAVLTSNGLHTSTTVFVDGFVFVDRQTVATRQIPKNSKRFFQQQRQRTVEGVISSSLLFTSSQMETITTLDAAAVDDDDKRSSAASSTKKNYPKLIVFDLDNTLWTPELYQLKKKRGIRGTPTINEDIRLFDGSAEVIKEWIPKLSQEYGIQFGIASRTQSTEWAHELLSKFGIRHLFQYVEIYPSNKEKHFRNIKQQCSSYDIDYSDMLFFDDARGGKYGNCEPISQLGVLSVHCPEGIKTIDIFTRALEKYQEWDKSPSSIVERDGTISTGASRASKVGTGGPKSDHQRWTGRVKFVNREKRYGFITYRYGTGSYDTFFPFRNLSSSDHKFTIPNEGDEVSFVLLQDEKSNRYLAGEVTIEQPIDDTLVAMKCFSMNNPFAALLVNGYKTLETRNGTMFTPYAEGSQVLLHIGRRYYPDGDKHIDIMKANGLSENEIADLKCLSQGYGKGNIVAIVELGKTYEASLSERSQPDFERQVVAYGADSGKIVTEIRRTALLKKPIRVSGQSGVFRVYIPPDVIPDGWTVPKTNNEVMNGSSNYNGDDDDDDDDDDNGENSSLLWATITG